MIFMAMPYAGSGSANGVGNKWQQRKMACALDGVHKLTLVFCARTGDAFGDDLSLFGNEALKFLFILVVDVQFFCVAESACTLLSGCLIVPFTAGASGCIHWCSPC
jgi:hypothetical protein